MVDQKDDTRFHHSWPLWRWILTGLNILALVLSVLMSWHYLKGGPMIGCDGGSACEQVLNSQWSNIGIFPISGLAVGVYLALLVSGLFIGWETELSLRRLAWKVMLILAGAVTGSAIWFTIVQKWFIGHFCPYCMTVHITGLFLAVLVIRRAIIADIDHQVDIPVKDPSKAKRKNQEFPGHIIRPLHVIGLSLIGIVMAVILATVQIILKPSSIYIDGESKIQMPVIDYNSVPMVGSPDAPYVVTLLFDYQCTHCQKIHFMLNEAVDRYNGKLAFAICPSPLNRECNPFIQQDADAFRNSCELARIGMAVWIADKKAFSAFEDWMFTFESGNNWFPRSIEDTKAKAIELVGQMKFESAMSDPWISKYLQTCVMIYGQTVLNGKGGIPRMVYGSRWVIPQATDAKDLIMILQRTLALPIP
jgi:uncharacterized membrane protein